MVKKIVILLLLLTTASAFGQDIHYSQYFNSPLSLNPAETGNFEGDWRGIMNYRSQWSAIGFPYNTFSASYDQHVNYKNNQFSPGIYYINDKSGNSFLNANLIYASCAYNKIINKNRFGVGIQIGMVIKNINRQVTLPDQWDENDGHFTRPPSPIDLLTSGKTSLNFLDINLGATWKRKINRYEPEVGISFFHLNHPNESFLENTSSRKPLRSAIYASVKTEINQNIYIKPGFMLFSVRGSRDMMIGSQIGYKMPGNGFNVSEAYGGIYLRNGIFNNADAMMVLIGAQVHSLNINLSYDVNISSLSSYTNNRGAVEISIIFKNISTVIKTFTIPCERI